MVEAWKTWLADAASALGEAASEVVAAGLAALVKAGLSAAIDSID
jgi:hypothetical protein